MAKFGWDERRLFYVSEVALENLSGTPATDADTGQTLLYIKGDHLYYKHPSVSEVIIVENGSNVGAGLQWFKQKNSTGQLEFRTLTNPDGYLTITQNADDISVNVDAADLNDNLDHGALLGLADDDHLQYLLLAGRSGGQIANGGTAASNNLILRSTAHATKGAVQIDDDSKFIFNSRTDEENEVSTTDATVTTISTIALADDTVYHIRVVIVGRRISGGQDRSVSALQGAFYRAAAGSATQQGSTFSEFRADSNGGFDTDLSTSGNNVIVTVKGVAATNMDWKVQTFVTAQN